MRIWKFRAPLTDEHFVIEIPAMFARPLTVQMQDGEPYLWAIGDPEGVKRRWHFHWIGTGHDVPQMVFDGGNYVGTVQTMGFAFHLFESGFDE